MATRFRSGELRFRISVTISHGKVTIHPDPAEVEVGSVVEWHFVPAPNLGKLEVEVFFNAGTPFTWSASKTRLPPSARDSTPGVIEAVPQDPGDYKYGIRASDFDSQALVAEEDPILIVRLRRQ